MIQSFRVRPWLLSSLHALTAFPVCLTPFAEFGLQERPVLVFKVTASDRFNGSTRLESMKASLEVNPRLTKAFGYVKRLIKVGTALSEVSGQLNLSPPAQSITAQPHRESCHGTG